MSFLSNIMSSIDGRKPSASPVKTPSTSRPVPPVAAAKPPTTTMAVDTKNLSKPSAPVPLKRKAEEASASTNVKAARLEPPKAPSAGPSRSVTASPAQRPGPGPPKTAPSVGVPKPVQKTSAASAIARTSTPPVAAPATKPPAPKTGYLAMLERAKAAQEAAKAMGQIKHVKKDVVSRRDRDRMRAEALANKGRAGTIRARQSRSHSVETSGSKVTKAAKPERKPVDVGYKGTIRPNTTGEPSYRGTMHSGRGGMAGLRGGAAPSHDRTQRYNDYSDEEEEEEDDDEEMEDEEGDYGSDLSDMEAGLDDIEREDMQSTMLARKEDEEAMREENELKRQKMERKRKLEALEAAASKQKKRY